MPTVRSPVRHAGVLGTAVALSATPSWSLIAQPRKRQFLVKSVAEKRVAALPVGSP